MFKFKKRTLIFPLLAILLLISFCAALPAFRIILLNPLNIVFNTLNFAKGEFYGIVFYHRNILEAKRLKAENEFLRFKINNLNEISLENIRLKSLLALKQEAPYKVIAAKVVSRSIDSWSSVVLINKGSFHGVKKGMAVMSSLGLAGKVIETSQGLSKVLLMNDPALSVSGIVQRSRQEGLVSGTLGSNLIMRYLPDNADIRIDDVVVTSGLNNILPKGLVIGTVIKIGNEFSGLSRYALVRPSLNLSNIEEVLVVIR